MSKLEVKEITPISGETDLTLGQSGGTVTLATGATAVGFGDESPVKAWVNFDGAAASGPAIRESMNVSSVSDNGIGDYTVNFTTAMPDANYCALVTGSRSDTRNGFSTINGPASFPATGYLRVCGTVLTTSDVVDVKHCMVAILS